MPLHRTPLRTELELRRLDSELTRLREDLKEKKKGTELLHNPTWLAILGAIVTVATGVWQLHANRQLEHEKLRSTLIQEASKSANSETTLKNLKFLVKAGLPVTLHADACGQPDAEHAASRYPSRLAWRGLPSGQISGESLCR